MNVVATQQKMKEYMMAKTHTKWLGERGRRTTWNDKMRGLEANLEDSRLEVRGSF